MLLPINNADSDRPHTKKTNCETISLPRCRTKPKKVLNAYSKNAEVGDTYGRLIQCVKSVRFSNRYSDKIGICLVQQLCVGRIDSVYLKVFGSC